MAIVCMGEVIRISHENRWFNLPKRIIEAENAAIMVE